MNINEALQNQEIYTELGPFEISKAYPPGKGPRFLLIKDQHGSTALKIWGPAGSNTFNQGDIVTLVPNGPQASIKREENAGKTALVANGCTVRFENAQQSAPSGGHASTQRSAAPSFSQPSDKDNQIMRQNALAHATHIVVAMGVSDHKRAAEMVLEIAPAFATYSSTGATDYIPM